jgi:hypothetical protein
LTVPLYVVFDERRKNKEALFELYEMKREQFKLYKETGDIRKMNRFLEVVNE